MLYSVKCFTIGTMTLSALLKRPSAFLPIAMSLAAIAVLVGHIAMYGIARQADEGTAAHLWQLLMGAQVPIIAFFAIKWWPEAPRQVLQILAVQIAAALASLAPVAYFNF